MVFRSSQYTPAAWSNQSLVLYHGTLRHRAELIIQNGVDLSKARASSDFGRGFYTTTFERQAQSWAWLLRERIVDYNERRRPENAPVLLHYEISREAVARLKCLWFVRGLPDAKDFWSFIFHCRLENPGHRYNSPTGYYDLVIGPVADNWRERSVRANYDQISFHTDSAIALLKNPTLIYVMV